MKHIYLFLAIILLSQTVKAQYVLQPSDVTVSSEGYIAACSKTFSDAETDIVIPETINGITIVGIKDGACQISSGVFYGKGLTSVKFPVTMQYIGRRAFSYNPITRVNFSNCTNLKSIGDHAFNNMQLTSVDLSSCTKLTTIGSVAFVNNPTLVGTLDLSNLNMLSSIGHNAFYNCSLSKVIIHSPILKLIASKTFANNNLDTVDLKGCESLELISPFAFKDNDIKFVDFSNCLSLTTIRYGAFQNNTITSLSFPSSVVLYEIGDYAFANNNIETLNLNNSPQLTTLGISAFENNNIETLNLNNSPQLTTLGISAFENNQITTLVLPECPNITTISNNCFKDNNLTAIDFSVFPNLTTIGIQAFESNKLNGNQNLYNNTNINYIGNKAFANNSSIQGVTLPNVSQWMSGNMQTYLAGVITTDYESAYYQYYTLTSADVEVVNGEIISCNYNLERSAIIIPDELDGQQVTSIANSANNENLFKNKRIHSLKLPSTLETINELAFSNCSLEVVDFSNCINLKFIGDRAFYDNSIHAVIGLQNCLNLITVGYRAFCSNQNTITSLILPYLPATNNHTFGWGQRSEYLTFSDVEPNDQGKYEISDFSLKYVQSYSVIFTDYDSTYLGTDTVTRGYNAALPTTPQRADYTFVGWSPDVIEISDTLTVQAQYVRNDKDNIIFKLSTTSGEPISSQPITITSSYSTKTESTNGNGITSFTYYAGSWNFSVGGIYFYENIYGVIDEPSTTIIDTLNILSFKKPTDYSGVLGEITLNGKEQKHSFEHDIYVPNGEYQYTINTFNKKVVPNSSGTIIINNNNAVNIPYHQVIFTVKTNEGTLLSGADVRIPELELYARTDEDGLATIYLPTGTYTYSISHSLLAGTIEQSLDIEATDQKEEVILYQADFILKNNQFEPYTNASLTSGNVVLNSDAEGIASAYLVPGWFKYKLEHSQIVAHTDSINIENEQIHEYININKVSFNITANGVGISNATVAIGDKTIITDANGFATANMANGTYQAVINHHQMCKDSLITIAAFNNDFTVDIAFHQVNFAIVNSDATAYDGANLNIADTTRPIPAVGITLFLPLGEHFFEINHAEKLAGKVTGTVINETSASTYSFTVYNATFNFKTAQGEITQSNATIGDIKVSSDANGTANIKLFNGNYAYGISNNHFTDNITIANQDTVINLNNFYTAGFTVNYPDGKVAGLPIININGTTLVIYEPSGDDDASINLPAGVYPYTIISRGITGEINDTLYITDHNPDTIRTIINPIEFIVKTPDSNIISDGDLTIGDELYSTSDTVYAFSGNYDYIIKNPLIKDLISEAVYLETNTYGTDYKNHIQKEEILLHELVLLEEGAPITNADFYIDWSPDSQTSAIEILNNGVLYFANAGTHFCKIVFQGNRGVYEEYINFIPGISDTIDLFVLEFNSNSEDYYLVVDSDTLSSNSNIRKISKFLTSSEYNYKTFFKNETLEILLDSGTVGPSHKIITQNIYAPTYAIISDDNKPQTNASLKTSPNNHAVKETDFIHRVAFLESDTITCTVNCEGYKDSTFTAHSDANTHVISLVKDTNTYYIVTFNDWNGTQLKTERVVRSNNATEPTEPTRTDYTFTGWDGNFSNVTSNLTITAQYSISTMVNDLETGNIFIYPNPANDFIIIKSLDYNSSIPTSVKIYNINGMAVYQGRIHCASTKINVNKWEAGSYILVVTAGDSCKRKLIVKQ